jgi:hypothetical protein
MGLEWNIVKSSLQQIAETDLMKVKGNTNFFSYTPKPQTRQESKSKLETPNTAIFRQLKYYALEEVPTTLDVRASKKQFSLNL